MNEALRTTTPGRPHLMRDVRGLTVRALAFDFERRIDMALATEAAFDALAAGI